MEWNEGICEFSVQLWTHLVKPLLSYQGHRHNLESGGKGGGGGGGFVRGHEKVCPQVLYHYQFQYITPPSKSGGLKLTKPPTLSTPLFMAV